jgi:hypothetical protein
MKRLLLLAGGLVACGLSLSDPLLLDDTVDGGRTSTSSGQMMSSGASGSGGTSSSGSSVTPVDAGADGPAMGTVDAAVPTKGDAAVCDGRPTPNYATNGKCYWLGPSAGSAQAEQVASCDTGAPRGVPFDPRDYGDLQISSQLSMQSSDEFVWETATYIAPGLFGATQWKFQPSGNTFALPVDHGNNENCLRARHILFPLYDGVQHDSVKCDNTKLKVVCQSP